MTVHEKLEAAWQSVAARFGGRDYLEWESIELVYKVGWIDGHNAALEVAREAIEPAVREFQEILEGTGL